MNKMQVHPERANLYWSSWEEKAKTDPKAAAIVTAFRHRPVEEYYNVVEDSLELNNLADDPLHHAEMDRLRALLTAWMAEQGDKGEATELLAETRQPRSRRN